MKALDNPAPVEGPPAPAPLDVARAALAGLSILAAFALPNLFSTGYRSGSFAGTYSLQWTLLLAGACLLAGASLAGFVLLLVRPSGRLAGAAGRAFGGLARLGAANWLAFAAVWLVYVLGVLWRFGRQFPHFAERAWLFWAAACLGAVFLAAARKNLPALWALTASAVIYGAALKALGYLPDVTSYPFTLEWSEASRFYYASLPYAERLYGMSIPLSPWHPSRYLLLGLPYLIPGTTLFMHRLWQVLLWLALSLGTGLALARRLRLPGGAPTVLGALWAALFLLQGPVYYHLLVCVIPLLLWFDPKRFWRSLGVVVLASLWAGISRVNWFPVPAMLAATLYLLEAPLGPAGGWARYLLKPAGWGAGGLLAALAAQAAYIPISGHEASAFGSSFTSDLLWYRLLPSPTYRLGVLPAILLITAPLLAAAGGSLLRAKDRWHALRLLGLGAMALALLAVGAVVSTKIGGGSNIHNLDAFLVLALVLGSYAWLGRGAPERGARLPAWKPWLLTLLIAAIPVTWNLADLYPFVQRPTAKAFETVRGIQQILDKAAPEGEVLFITQRQLLTFGEITRVRMVPEYEVLTLSEMAISNNRAYLQRFYQDLRSHRFAVIIASPQNTIIKDPAVAPFSEENNAWVEHISTQILQYYKESLTLDEFGIVIYVPR